MISPEEIKRQALRRWNLVLEGHIQDKKFVPITIDRIGKVKPGEIRQQFEKIQQEVEILLLQSKNQTGIGYLVEKAGYNFRRSGNHDLPECVIIETLDDFLHITGKEKDWAIFIKNYGAIYERIPALKDWAMVNTTWLVKKGIDWEGILKVCNYFISVPRPGLYLRQLPIEIHTKFIEENASLLQSLLDFLIAEHIRDKQLKRFSERYFLKYDEPLIRIRILDKDLFLEQGINDISIPLSSFHSDRFNCKHILITENKMNFLTLPDIPSAIAVWSGGGFNISFLKNIEWLNEKEIFYWGDLDEHGFQILHQLRSYYPSCRSIMMDIQTYTAFQQFAVSTPPATLGNLALLTGQETEMLNLLRKTPDKNRLEQERILQEYAVKMIVDAINKK